MATITQNEEINVAKLTGRVVCGALPLNGVAGDPVFLPDIDCKFVILSNLTVTDAGAAKPGATASQQGSGNAGVEMYWGFNGKTFAQLFTGSQTDMIRVNNAQQINVRGTGTVYYACFN